jgi:CBS-domain-containing membrane protein
MPRLTSPFSRWVYPSRLLGSIIMIYGIVRVLFASDVAGIVFGVFGALVWQLGTKLSPLFRRLAEGCVGNVMASNQIIVPSWWRVSDVRKRFPAVDTNSFFVTTQDSYKSGVVLPEEIYSASVKDSRYLSIGQVARPISYVNAARMDDSLLEAFSTLESLGREHMVVVDDRENLAGVITRKHIDAYLRTSVEEAPTRFQRVGRADSRGTD